MAAGSSSTGISPRPMLMGAPRNALRAFNAGVSLSCLCILAHRLPHLFRGLVLSLACLVGVPSCGLATGSWRTGRPAPHRQIVSVCLMLARLQREGYEIKRGKYISARAPDQERFTRLKTLGADYTEEAVVSRIAGGPHCSVNICTTRKLP